MDASSHKLLENVVLKTLHAHSFTRSSSQASLVLSDLLSRYIVLLATTCSQYAQHAGRFNLTVRDAMSALDELGVSMDELHEYCGTEGDELARYSAHSVKRQEDLSEFKGQLERDDRIFCINASASRVQRPWRLGFLSSTNQYRWCGRRSRNPIWRTWKKRMRKMMRKMKEETATETLKWLTLQSQEIITKSMSLPSHSKTSEDDR